MSFYVYVYKLNDVTAEKKTNVKQFLLFFTNWVRFLEHKLPFFIA